VNSLCRSEKYIISGSLASSVPLGKQTWRFSLGAVFPMTDPVICCMTLDLFGREIHAPALAPCPPASSQWLHCIPQAEMSCLHTKDTHNWLLSIYWNTTYAQHIPTSDFPIGKRSANLHCWVISCICCSCTFWSLIFLTGKLGNS